MKVIISICAITNTEEKEWFRNMIAINLQEKEEIRKKYPNVKITRTMKQDSKRHHYYMEEARGPMNLLRHLRGEDTSTRKRKRV